MCAHASPARAFCVGVEPERRQGPGEYPGTMASRDRNRSEAQPPPPPDANAPEASSPDDDVQSSLQPQAQQPPFQPSTPPRDEAPSTERDGGYAELKQKLSALEREKAELVLRMGDLEELHARAKRLRVGEHVVLAENGDFETVLLHRKRTVRPTGRYVPRHHYKFAIHKDDELLSALREQGAVTSAGADGTDTVVVSLSPNTRPLRDDERPPAYNLPPDIAKHALAAGAVDEEVA